jgi:hypothetical protein
VHEWLYPKDIASTTTEAPRTSETPEQAAALRYLTVERGCTAELFKDFLDMVHARFYLVRRDIGRYMGRFQVSHTPHKQHLGYKDGY